MPANGWRAARRRRRSTSRSRRRNYALAIATKDRKDDVRLSTALHKLTEEDRALDWEQDEAMHETRLKGVNDEHLKVTLERLKRRYGVAVDSRRRRRSATRNRSARRSPSAAGTRSSRAATASSATCVIEVKPLPRGEGFKFNDKISGGVVPKQWIPAVEDGRARRARQGAARLPGGRRRGDPDRRLLPQRRQLGARLPHRGADRHGGGARRRPRRICSSRCRR